MVKGFSKRKVATDLTLGEMLKCGRESKNISIEEAETGSKVKAKYLVSLEKDDWGDLPSSVHVRGFVMAYSKFIGLNVSEALGLFDREKKLYKKESVHNLSYKRTIKDVPILITPKLLGYVAAVVLIAAFFGYISYQVRGFAGTPDLKITSPGNNQIFEDDSIEIAGVADIDAVLRINQEVIPITNDGHFISDVKLHKGVNVIKVEAVNKAKKQTSEVLTIEYKPKTALINLNTNQ
ncbi:MAG: helix-turn-helix domain-containing protein [Patescibacteria group bacterium]|jgi:cytoskeletal protein RodZ